MRGSRRIATSSCQHLSSFRHLPLYQLFSRWVQVSVQKESNPKGGDMLRSTARAVLSLLVAAMVVPAVGATTAVERTESDMVQESALIVTGHLTHLRSRWVGRTLVTLATIQVSEAPKGAPGTT